MIRPALASDVEALVALRAVVWPYLIRGVDGTRAWIALVRDEGGEIWVGEEDGRIVGSSYARLEKDTSEVGAAVVGLYVHPDHRRVGHARALWGPVVERLEALGADRVQAWARADSLDYAGRRGFVASREVEYSALELVGLEQEPVPAGVEVRSAADVDPHELWAADVETSRDEPGDLATDALDRDRWLARIWADPELDREASVVARVDGRIAAFTLVQVDGDRAWSGMTGTLRAHRGRGLARLVKQVALERVAERGVRVAYTANDLQNAPMLAINRRLGYRRVATHWTCLGRVPR